MIWVLVKIPVLIRCVMSVPVLAGNSGHIQESVRASLVAQWLRIFLPMLGTPV